MTSLLSNNNFPAAPTKNAAAPVQLIDFPRETVLLNTPNYGKATARIKCELDLLECRQARPGRAVRRSVVSLAYQSST